MCVVSFFFYFNNTVTSKDIPHILHMIGRSKMIEMLYDMTLDGILLNISVSTKKNI
jgi:hypothetical protein